MVSDVNEQYGGIEAGGTKFVCAIGTGPKDIKAMTRFITTTPDETLGKAIDFFKREQKKRLLEAIGIASFGLIDLIPGSPDFGYITNTPKPGWSNTNLVGILRETLGVPVYMDTDVNLSALSEKTRCLPNFTKIAWRGWHPVQQWKKGGVSHPWKFLPNIQPGNLKPPILLWD